MSIQLQYKVVFSPGTYKYTKTPGAPGRPDYYNIGREDTGDVIAFTFDENQAAHICLALNLVHSYIAGYTAEQTEILKALEKFRH